MQTAEEKRRSRERYLRLRADPKAWQRRKDQVNSRRGGGEGPQPHHNTPAKPPRLMPEPNALPGISKARLMGGR